MIALFFLFAQETEKMQKHKNDLIFKLEGKTTAMAETLRKLDEKYVKCQEMFLLFMDSKIIPRLLRSSFCVQLTGPP